MEQEHLSMNRGAAPSPDVSPFPPGSSPLVTPTAPRLLPSSPGGRELLPPVRPCPTHNPAAHTRPSPARPHRGGRSYRGSSGAAGPGPRLRRLGSAARQWERRGGGAERLQLPPPASVGGRAGSGVALADGKGDGCCGSAGPGRPLAASAVPNAGQCQRSPGPARGGGGAGWEPP